MKRPVKSCGICPRDDTGTKKCNPPKFREEQQNLRYIFLTSFILIVTSYYIYPCLFLSQNKRHSNMMTSRTSRYTSFAGAISEKLQNDRFWLEGDKSHWYNIEKGELHNSNVAAHNVGDIASKFVQLEADEETKYFVLQCVNKADQLLTQMWHNLAKTVLKRFFGYTQTDINGYLRRGSMFVLSTQQYILLKGKEKDVFKSQRDRHI